MAKARTVGIAIDYSATSKVALGWAIENLIEEGDLMIVIHVQTSSKTDPTNKQLFQDTGSPLIPLVEFKEISVCKKYGLNPDPEVFDMLDTVTRTKGGVDWECKQLRGAKCNMPSHSCEGDTYFVQALVINMKMSACLATCHTYMILCPKSMIDERDYYWIPFIRCLLFLFVFAIGLLSMKMFGLNIIAHSFVSQSNLFSLKSKQLKNYYFPSD